MALTGADSNNYNVILKHKHHAPSCPNDTISDKKESNVFLDGFGETAKRKIVHKQKRLSASEIESIIAEYQNGSSTYVLAEKYGYHRNTISENLKKHNITVTAEKISSKEDVKELISLYESGMKTKEVAAHLGVNFSTVLRHLRDNGVKMRTRWDY